MLSSRRLTELSYDRAVMYTLHGPTTGLFVMPRLHVKIIKYFKYYYFSLRRRPSEIVLFRRVETCLKLFRRIIAAHECFRTRPMSLKWLRNCFKVILFHV